MLTVINLCFKLAFRSPRVFVVETDGVKSVSVMEGDSVTLHTGVSEIQRDDVITWFEIKAPSSLT